MKINKYSLMVAALVAIAQLNALAADVPGDRLIIGNGSAVTGSYASVAGGISCSNSGLASFIGGGLGNILTGSASAITGGQGNSVASDYASLVGGLNNVIQTNVPYSVIGGGYVNTNNAEGSTIAGGEANVTVGEYSSVGGGYYNVALGNSSTIVGGNSAMATNYGQMAYASGQFSSVGDAQTSTLVLRNTTANTNQTELFLDGSGERFTLLANRAVAYDILLIGRNSSGNVGANQIKGVIQNNAGTVSLVGTPPANVVLGVDGTSANWGVSVSADNTHKSLAIKVTGDNSSIRWVATVRTVEVNQ